VHVPAATIVTVAVLTFELNVVEPTVHTPVVEDEYETVNPFAALVSERFAVEEIVNGGSEGLLSGGEVRSIVWPALVITMLSITFVAGSYDAFPAWLATIVHVPAATIVTVATDALPLNELAPTVQTLVSAGE